MEAELSGIHESDCGAVFRHPVAENLQWLDAPGAPAAKDAKSVRTVRTVETVMTTIVAGVPERPFSTPTSYACVCFRMQCSARDVYLLIGNDDGRAIALQQLEKDEVNQWQLTMKLKVGSYRYRYYANRGVTTAHAGSYDSDNAPIRMDDFASFAFSSISSGNESAAE